LNTNKTSSANGRSGPTVPSVGRRRIAGGGGRRPGLPDPEEAPAALLVDVEVVGDDLYVQEPKDEQRESGHADEREHDQDEARESVGREVSRATWLAPVR
jgi:hypothetical protein